MATDSEEGSIFDLDTVRSLHKTVIALRTALERSKAELESVRKSCGTMDDKNKVNSYDYYRRFLLKFSRIYNEC